MKIMTEYLERKKWFLERVGKRVYRDPNTCPCETCKRIAVEGLIIHDESHAIYLHDIESISRAEGHPLKYRDEL